jgi:hypothetical protein
MAALCEGARGAPPRRRHCPKTASQDGQRRPLGRPVRPKALLTSKEARFARFGPPLGACAPPPACQRYPTPPPLTADVQGLLHARHGLKTPGVAS